MTHYIFEYVRPVEPPRILIPANLVSVDWWRLAYLSIKRDGKTTTYFAEAQEEDDWEHVTWYDSAGYPTPKAQSLTKAVQLITAADPVTNYINPNIYLRAADRARADLASYYSHTGVPILDSHLIRTYTQRLIDSLREYTDALDHYTPITEHLNLPDA